MFSVKLAIPEVDAVTYSSVASLVATVVCMKMSHSMSTWIDCGRLIYMEYHDKDTTVLSRYVGYNKLVFILLIPRIICICTIISSTQDTSASHYSVLRRLALLTVIVVVKNVVTNY